MIRIDENYTNYKDDSDPVGYPGGKAKSTSGGNRTDGTPWRALWFNTILGFFQAMIVDALGEFDVSGEPDKVGDSELLNALKVVASRVINPTLAARILKNEGDILSLFNRVTNSEGGINYLNQYVQGLVPEAPFDNKIRGRINGAWAIVEGAGGGGLENAIKALMFYSEKSVLFSNADIATRRKRGWDIGLLFLSPTSKVYHFDTDLNDQNQESQVTIAHNGTEPVLVGGDDTNGMIYFDPAVKEIAPHELKGKSLWGNFSIAATLQGPNATAEFWMRLFDVDNEEVASFENTGDKIALLLGGQEPSFNDPSESVQFNIDPSVLFNAPAATGNYVRHSWDGGHEDFDLDEAGVNIGVLNWIYSAFVFTPDQISLFINNLNVDFLRHVSAATPITLAINKSLAEINIDELLLDNAAQNIDNFSQNTQDAKPWAAISDSEKTFVLEAQDITKVKTNLFETDSFKEAVQKIIDNQ